MSELKGTGSNLAEPEVIQMEDSSRVRDLEGEWLELASRIPGVSYFLTPDWVVSWWETIGGRPPTELAVWRDSSGALTALLYLSRVVQRLHPRVPPAWRVWTVTGSGVGTADHVGWPVPVAHREVAIRYALRRTRGASLFLPDLDPETGVPFVPHGARRLFRNPCPRVQLLPPDQVSANVRRSRAHFRRYEKRAAAAGIQFRWVQSRQMDEPFLDRLFELHAMRMAEKQVRSLFSESRGLQRRLIARGTADRGPVALVAELGTRIVGALYFFRWGDTLAHYNGGWQPDMAQVRIGTLLLIEAIKGGSASGLRTLDFLRGNEAYKYWLGGVDRWDESWIVPGGVSGQLLKVLVPVYRLAVRRAWSRQATDVS